MEDMLELRETAKAAIKEYAEAKKAAEEAQEIADQAGATAEQTQAAADAKALVDELKIK